MLWPIYDLKPALTHYYISVRRWSGTEQPIINSLRESSFRYWDQEIGRRASSLSRAIEDSSCTHPSPAYKELWAACSRSFELGYHCWVNSALRYSSPTTLGIFVDHHILIAAVTLSFSTLRVRRRADYLKSSAAYLHCFRRISAGCGYSSLYLCLMWVAVTCLCLMACWCVDYECWFQARNLRLNYLWQNCDVS